MAEYGITLGYEKDKCSVCKKEKEVRLVYHKPTSQVASLCDECANSLSSLSIQELIERFGKKTTEKHIQILTKEELQKKGFELTGKKEPKK